MATAAADELRATITRRLQSEDMNPLAVTVVTESSEVSRAMIPNEIVISIDSFPTRSTR
jgi:hypothetical protein